MSTSYDTNSAAEIQIEKEIQNQKFKESFLKENKRQKGKAKMLTYQEFTLGFFTGLILNIFGILISFWVVSKHFQEGVISGFIYFMFFAILSVFGYSMYNYGLLY